MMKKLLLAVVFLIGTSFIFAKATTAASLLPWSEELQVVIEEEAGELYWPLPSEYGPQMITSDYGYREGTYGGLHKGIDVGCPEGTPVFACREGTVVISERSDSAGNWIVLDHGDGLFTEYMHLSQCLKMVGEEVYAGEVIGESGNTGWSTGPHLHIGLAICEGDYNISCRTDPNPYLSAVSGEKAVFEKTLMGSQIVFIKKQRLPFAS